MGKELREYGAIFVRESIKEGLGQCTEAQVMLFRRMYSHKDLAAEIGPMVDAMPYEQLETAMDQVQRTVIKNIRNA